MSLKCRECGELTHKKIGNYRYKESGLDNVYLENISIYECSCGISYPSIFRLGRLNDQIALTLAEKPALLNGDEIRFLRKNLHMPSKFFAGKLGVGKTTLSKWEHNLQNHSEGHDRLIRAIYIIEKGVRRRDQLKIQTRLENISLKKANCQYLIIAEKIQDDYVLKYTPVLSESKPFSSLEFSTWKNWSGTTSGVGMGSAGVFGTTPQTHLYQMPIIVKTEPLSMVEGTKTHATETAEI